MQDTPIYPLLSPWGWSGTFYFLHVLRARWHKNLLFRSLFAARFPELLLSLSPRVSGGGAVQPKALNHFLFLVWIFQAPNVALCLKGQNPGLTHPLL